MFVVLYLNFPKKELNTRGAKLGGTSLVQPGQTKHYGPIDTKSGQRWLSKLWWLWWWWWWWWGGGVVIHLLSNKTQDNCVSVYGV